MVDAISSSMTSAISGLRAQEKKMANIANNVANATTSNYQPVDTVMISKEATVLAQTTLRGSEGVDLQNEMIGTIEAEHAFKASTEVLRTLNDMHDALLNAIDREA